MSLSPQPSIASEICLVNGVPGNVLGTADRGLQFGDGVFETMRIVNSRPVLADLHWQRLQHGLNALGISLDISVAQAQLQTLLDHAAAEDLCEGVAKLIVTRGNSARGFAAAQSSEPNIVCRWQSLASNTNASYRDGIELQPSAIRLPDRPHLAGAKHLNCLEYVLARAALAGKANCDALMLDGRGNIIEASSSNLFLLCDGQLLTPELDRCGIAGTMRRWIMQSLAPELGLSCMEKILPASALGAAQEVFICNSVQGVVPIVVCNEYQWSPGSVSRSIQQRVEALFNV